MGLRLELFAVNGKEPEAIECGGAGWLQVADKDEYENSDVRDYILKLKKVKSPIQRQIASCIEEGLIAAIFVVEEESKVQVFPVGSNPKGKLIGVKKVSEKSGNVHNHVPKIVKKSSTRWVWGKVD